MKFDCQPSYGNWKLNKFNIHRSSCFEEVINCLLTQRFVCHPNHANLFLYDIFMPENMTPRLGSEKSHGIHLYLKALHTSSQ